MVIKLMYIDLWQGAIRVNLIATSTIRTALDRI
uniref:Uncharacterized protein n=1 Tax=Arundo donax TaxID=35708 RepID=A0A0A9BIG8_ARUDO